MRKLFGTLHLWLSIPFGLIISVLCFSGALLVFETELQELLHPKRYFVEAVKEKPIPLENLIPLVVSQLPDSVTISSVSIPSERNKNYRMGLAGQGRTSLTVDPYTGEIRGKIIPYAKGNFFSGMRKMHRWLLFPYSRGEFSWGKWLTGTTTFVCLFILLTGIAIWVPKSVKSLKRRLIIGLRKGNFRFWYDLHIAGGIYTVIFLLVFCLTGLTWSFNWYRNGFYKVFGAEIQQSAPAPTIQPSAVLSTDAKDKSQDRGLREKAEAPESSTDHRQEQSTRETGKNTHNDERTRETGKLTGETTRNGKRTGETGKTTEENTRDEESIGESENDTSGTKNYSRGGIRERNVPVNYAVWDQILASLQTGYPNAPSISIQNETASATLYKRGNIRASDLLNFSARTGEITEIQLYANSERSVKIRGWIYSVHTGAWGGFLTKLLSFLACLIGTTLPLTGYYFYLKKRQIKHRKGKTCARV